MAAGVVLPICIGKPEKLNMGEECVYNATFNGIVAVDGERELAFSKGDRLAFQITREGPYHVDIEKTLEAAQRDGFFERPVNSFSKS